MGRVSVLGCPVDNLTLAQVIDRVGEIVAAGKPTQGLVVNAAKLWLMERDPRLDRIVKAAEMVLPEKAIVLGSRWLGEPLAEPVLGITLLQRLLEEAPRRKWRIFFLGAREAVVAQMVARLRAQHPGIQIAGYHNGYWKPEDEASIVNGIATAQADLLFVAMGTPKQEYWIHDHLNALGVPFCFGVGGSFDVLAGLKKDAPAWVRTLSMEWLYRLAQDPKNLWKRYTTTIPWFLIRVLKERLGRSSRREA